MSDEYDFWAEESLALARESEAADFETWPAWECLS
jgi:hypothetical protein